MKIAGIVIIVILKGSALYMKRIGKILNKAVDIFFLLSHPVNDIRLIDLGL